MQQSVCLLPLRDGLQPQLENLKTEIVERGGEADLLTITIADDQQNARLIERFQQQAESEYKEFLGRCRDFHQELKYDILTLLKCETLLRLKR